MTQFLGTARSDEQGHLFITALTTERSSQTVHGSNVATSVFRLGPGDEEPTVLFSNRPRAVHRGVNCRGGAFQFLRCSLLGC